MTKKWVAETRWRTRSFKEAAVEELKECSKDHPCEYLNKNYSRNHFYRSDNVTVTTFFILQKKRQKIAWNSYIEYDKLMIWESRQGVFINEGRRRDWKQQWEAKGTIMSPAGPMLWLSGESEKSPLRLLKITVDMSYVRKADYGCHFSTSHLVK